MVNEYKVTFQVRNRGAIGAFWQITVPVYADTFYYAKDKGFDILQSQGYETGICETVEDTKTGKRYGQKDFMGLYGSD